MGDRSRSLERFATPPDAPSGAELHSKAMLCVLHWLDSDGVPHCPSPIICAMPNRSKECRILEHKYGGQFTAGVRGEVCKTVHTLAY